MTGSVPRPYAAWSGGRSSRTSRTAAGIAWSAANLDSGIFNDDLMQPLGTRADRAWRRASVETRAMAVLAHEDIEGRGHTHEEAVEMAPDTALPITHAARELLRIIREEQRRRLREGRLRDRL